MGFLSVIRRWALRDKMPIREIARRTGLSRNTIKKYLREDAVEPKFKRHRGQASWILMQIGCRHGFWPRRESLVKSGATLS